MSKTQQPYQETEADGRLKRTCVRQQARDLRQAVPGLRRCDARRVARKAVASEVRNGGCFMFYAAPNAIATARVIVDCRRQQRARWTVLQHTDLLSKVYTLARAQLNDQGVGFDALIAFHSFYLQAEAMLDD